MGCDGREGGGILMVVKHDPLPHTLGTLCKTGGGRNELIRDLIISVPSPLPAERSSKRQ